ncbi:MAG: hemolysin family protein [Eubacteriales bacterium]|nr:hemolysin family protein [Eubacteriales bacterium]
MDSDTLLRIMFLVFLIFTNAFFASSEIAIISLNDNKIRKMAEEGSKKAGLLAKLTSEPSNFLSTIQIGVTVAGLLASAFTAESFAGRLTSAILGTGLNVNEEMLKLLVTVALTIILSYFTLVFGELVPKRIAMQKSEKLAMLVIRPLYALAVVAKPFIKFLSFSTDSVIRLFGGDPDAEEQNITEEEIRMMMDVGEEKGAILDSEKEMIDNIFEFNDSTASDVMTHRTDIIALPVTSTIDVVMNLMISEKFTRIPVYEDNIDNIVGILHVKDLLQYTSCENRPETFDLRDLARQPYFVPASKKSNELLNELQKNKVHMAVVIDEYGGTAGLVTIEDLIEEIVGNIFDEYDDDDVKEIEKISENTYIIDGKVDLDKVMDELEVQLPSDEFDTLSGFLVGQLGRIPEQDEKPVVEYENIIFTVESLDEKRIAKVKVMKTDPGDEGPLDLNGNTVAT